MNRATLFCTLAAPMALLAAPVAAAPAVGEVPLHIEATGTAEPDLALVALRIEGSGKDDAMAKAELAKRTAELSALLDQFGVAPNDRRVLKGDENLLLTVSTVDAPKAQTKADLDAAAAAMSAAQDAAEAAMAAAKEQRCASLRGKSQIKECREEAAMSTVNELWLVTLRKPEALNRLRELDREGIELTSPYRPAMQYSNPAAARDQAVAKALANARDEADRYARALGYRVVRIERVSNTKPAINLPDVMGAFGMMDNRESREQAFQQSTMTAGIAVDFVMVPK